MASTQGVAMTRKLGCFLIVMTLALSASAAVNPGSISGFVRNSGGTPQMGATVEILSAALQPILARTDANGFYTIKGLLPGTYTLKVTAPSFLPSLREKIGLQSGGSIVVNITLNTLFEALELVPRPSSGPEDQDDWKWTMRSVANRPVLRLADDGPLMVVSESDNADDRVLKAKVAFMAGSDGEAYSSPDMSTNFQLEQSIFGGDRWNMDGSVGYGTGAGTPSAIFRTTYKHKFATGSEPEIGVTVRRFATPEMMAGHSALQALALSMSDSMTIGDIFEFNYGGELQTVQFIGRATAFRPFGTADVHLGKNTFVEYRYATSVPNMRHAKGFESAPLDLSESGPRVSVTDSAQTIERAHHNEISISRREGKNLMQAAYYRDRVANPVITGVGEGVLPSADVLPDIYGNTFNYNGGELDTGGVRFVYQRKITDKINATVDYAFGGVLALGEGEVQWEDARAAMHTINRHAVAAKLAGTVPGSHTRWITSYRWTSGDALTPVDLFNVSAGQADPFLNVFIRQPLPGRHFIPAGLEALVDVRNLLAQGYRPVVGSDGQTVYLVQSARSIRGGLAYTF
jgi:hypothetical protein